MGARRQTEMPVKRSRPATTPEGRNKQLISYAFDLVEQRLLDGTASSQEVVHFLRLGTETAKLERKKLEAETALIVAKKNTQDAFSDYTKRAEEAIAAFKGYSGKDDAELY